MTALRSGHTEVLTRLIAAKAINDGHGSFSEQEMMIATDTSFATFIRPADLDGDIDVLSASNFDDKIAWYENVLSR